MRIRILWVGKTKEGYLAEGIGRYLDRLRPFAEVEVVELRDAPRGGPGAVEAEGRRILGAAGPFTLLDEGGARMTSRELAASLKDRARAEFVIGGAYGVSDAVRAAAAGTMSLSPMTLTHEMARLLLVEQLYRAFMINTGRGYHH